MTSNFEQTKEERELKLKAFKQAIDNGEVNHLINDIPIVRYEKILHGLVNDLLNEDTESDSELQLLQSILSMVYTMKVECRLADLNDCLKDKFPEYYY